MDLGRLPLIDNRTYEATMAHHPHNRSLYVDIDYGLMDKLPFHILAFRMTEAQNA